jgi:hypothetical protein
VAGWLGEGGLRLRQAPQQAAGCAAACAAPSSPRRPRRHHAPVSAEALAPENGMQVVRLLSTRLSSSRSVVLIMTVPMPVPLPTAGTGGGSLALAAVGKATKRGLLAAALLSNVYTYTSFRSMRPCRRRGGGGRRRKGRRAMRGAGGKSKRHALVASARSSFALQPACPQGPTSLSRPVYTMM